MLATDFNKSNCPTFIIYDLQRLLSILLCLRMRAGGQHDKYDAPDKPKRRSQRESEVTTIDVHVDECLFF